VPEAVGLVEEEGGALGVHLEREEVPLLFTPQLRVDLHIALNVRTTTSQKCAVVPRRARV